MRFTLAFVSLIAAAIAQSSQPNAFNIPDQGTLVFTAGQSKQLSWSNPTGSTVTLLLRTGSNGDLQTVSTIVSNYQNSGSYNWTPDTSLPEGADYAIEIVDDQDSSKVNYTPQFVIQNSIQVVATSGGSTSLVTEASGSATAASASATTTGSSATGSSSSASATASMTGSMTASMTASKTSAASSGASSMAASSSASATKASVPTTNAGRPAMQAGTGLLAVALGFAVAM